MPINRRSQALSAEETQYLVTLGIHLRRLRVERGLGLEELADRAGIHRTHLWKIEMGRLNAGTVSFMRLARHLGVSPGDLFPAFEEDLRERQQSRT